MVFSLVNLFPICFNECMGQFQRGYTLIELLVVITIIGLLFGGSIAAYAKFNQRQTVLAAGKQLLSDLRSALTKAASGVKPSGCTTLSAYELKGNSGASSYNISAVCSNNSSILVSSGKFNSGITLGTAVDVTFVGQLGGATGTLGNLTVTSSGLTYSLTVNSSGDISEGGLQ